MHDVSTIPEPERSESPLTASMTKYGLFMLTLVYAFNFVDRQILVILQEPIKVEMGLSDAQLGLLNGNGNFAPSFLIRNHGFSVGEVGILLAIFGGGGGMIGTFLGGYLSDRLGVGDRRWYLWLPAIAGLLSVPLGFPYLLLDNTVLVVGLLFFVTVTLNTYMGPSLAISHALVPPAMRAMSSAVLFFILNLIGLGLGPLTVGLLSDFYLPHFGEDSLRYAMLTLALLSSPAILMFYLGARYLPQDLEKGREMERRRTAA